MPKSNREIAALFERLADLLEIEDANPFRIRAYRNAASRIRGLTRELSEPVAEGEDLSKLPDIGEDIADKIVTIVETDRLPLLEEVQARTPPGLSEIMRIKGLGARKVAALHEKLGVSGVEDLKTAIDQHRVRKLEGFGEKTEGKIARALKALRPEEKRTLLAEAEPVAERLVRTLADMTGVGKVMVAGSYRRRKETIGDLDILVTARRSAKVSDRFVALDEVKDVVSHGHTRSTAVLRDGLQVDLRVVRAASYGAALLYFTGSKAHNIELRRMAAKKGLKINEEMDGFRVLKSAEVEILEDGSLDFEDSLLADLDVVICAVHSDFDLSRSKQTDRLRRAMDNARCHILAHPSCRLIGERPPLELDLEALMEHARDCGCALEINAQPKRLDLPDDAIRSARELGVKLVISSDAHSARGLRALRYGVDQARRGWLEAKDVLNARPLEQFLTALER